MPKTALLMTGAVALWILWCVFAIQVLVPAVQRHLTVWAQAIALVFCLAPVLLAAVILFFRAKKVTDPS